jgi:NAD(P)-dependent dehydrogenase (short-subunit alcohol dehydrogenase family)
MDRLKNKVVIVTGGSSGIGRATVLLFAREGARVAVGDVDVAGGEETVRLALAQMQGAAYPEAGGDTGTADVFFLRTDVSRAADADALVDATLQRWGALHVLHNNAYWAPTGMTVLNTSEDDWDRTQAVTLKSMYLMSRAALPAMLKAKAGAIVNTASVAGIVGSRGFSAYAAAKGGVVALTKAMAKDFGKQGIRVNCIAPGPIDTPATAELKKDPNWMALQMNRLLLSELGKPEDVAYAALYLASDEASFVTGSTLVVDGGATSN